MSAWDEVRAALRREAADAPPPPPTTIDKSKLYVAKSCMQKAVRFGLPNVAAEMAAALARLNEWSTFWRLGVIALEDVGPADPDLCARVLVAGLDKNLRAEVGAAKLAAHLAGKMAQSIKSRLCCDLYIAEDLRWLGTCTADMTETEDFVAALSRSPKVAEGLGRWFAIAAAIVRADPPVIETRQLPPVMIGDMLAAAYDMHTREGRRALLYFCKASDGVRRFLEQHPVKNRLLAIGNSVFDAEGGVCNRMLRSRLIDEATEASTRVYIRPTGLGREEYRDLVGIVASDLPTLHRSRERILRGIEEEQAERARIKPAHESLL